MIINRFGFFFLFAFLVFASTNIYAQTQTSLTKQKVLIDGKTYYIHVVQKGEGFYRISKTYGVSQKEIIEANPQVKEGLKVGEIINIPVIKGRNSSEEQIQKSSEYIYHTVEKGQTLYYISHKYNVSIDAIVVNNVGVDKSLLVGSIIKIPVDKVHTTAEDGYAYHKVEPHETLYAISKQYNTTVDSLVKINPALKSGVLSINSMIRVPVIEKAKVAVQDTLTKAMRIEDDEYIYHNIKANETLLSISQEYNANRRAVEEANKGINTANLPVGYVLRIPKSSIRTATISLPSYQDDFFMHSVRKKETLYSISKRYGVSIDDIKEINEDQNLSLKKGEKIKIPTNAYLRKIEEEKISGLSFKGQEYSQRGMYDSIQSLDCKAMIQPLNTENITVAILLPFDVDATERANIITKIVDEDTVQVTRDELIISPRSKTFVEFYEGALLAIDSLKKKGAHIHLLTFDTAPDSIRVKEILSKPEMQLADLIIGPAYASNLKMVSQFAKQKQIQMISPLSNINEEMDNNPMLFQVNTADTLLFDGYADYIANMSYQERVIIIKSANAEREEELLAKTIKDRIYLKHMQQGIMPDFKEITFSSQDIQGVAALMKEDDKNIVVIPSPKEADVSKIVTTLKGVKETTSCKIKLVGFSKWLRFQTINPDDIYSLDTDILTTQALDYNDELVQRFITKYRHWYGTEPYAVAPYFIRSGKSASYSRYGIWGYDVTYYFILARAMYGSKFEFCLPEFQQEQIQFNFNFVRRENWSGFYNAGLFVVKFHPQYDVTVQKLH